MEDDRGISVERVRLADLRLHRETYKVRERLLFRQDQRRWKTRQDRRDAEVREIIPYKHPTPPAK